MRAMKSIVIVGSGAREHALAWKLRQSPDAGALYVAPGNAGTALLAENVAIAATDLPAIIRFVEERDVALTVVGPEAPLALGLADRLRLRGRRVVGPGAAAARIEASKSFAKQLMIQAGVPTAQYAVFDRPENALRHIARAHFPLVVKADGLAAGKGVSICRDEHEARAAITAVMVDGVHGPAGRRVVVEEALSGPEISLLALVDGERVVTLPVAQDHKRLGAGDTGPNTGGMGAYAPVPFLDADEQVSLSKTVLEPVVAALAELGTPYQGVLFAGLMLTDAGPKVLEYNCRFGDPETQVILPLLADDLLPWLEAVATDVGGRDAGSTPRGSPKPAAGSPKPAAGSPKPAAGYPGLPLRGSLPVSDRSAVGVVLAAPGYPERPQVGAEIKGLEGVEENVLVFHAGTEQDAHGHVVTAGGRVLTVVGTGTSIEEAARRAYAAPVWFEGMQRRSDIARQGTPHPPTPKPATHLRGGQAPEGRGLYQNNRQLTIRAGGPGGHPQGDAPTRVAPTGSPSPALRERGLGGEGKIAVLASGDGSNLQALLDACRRGDVDAEVAVVVSNRAAARALERARRAGVPDIALPLRVREPDPHEGGEPDSHEGGEEKMTKLYFEPITVEYEGDRLQAFTWRRRVHRITAVLKRWIVRVDWWRQEISRQYYKVECENFGTYEIYCERGGWFLERLYD